MTSLTLHSPGGLLDRTCSGARLYGWTPDELVVLFVLLVLFTVLPWGSGAWLLFPVAGALAYRLGRGYDLWLDARFRRTSLAQELEEWYADAELLRVDETWAHTLGLSPSTHAERWPGVLRAQLAAHGLPPLDHSIPSWRARHRERFFRVSQALGSVAAISAYARLGYSSRRLAQWSGLSEEEIVELRHSRALFEGLRQAEGEDVAIAHHLACGYSASHVAQVAGKSLPEVREAEARYQAEHPAAPFPRLPILDRGELPCR